MPRHSWLVVFAAMTGFVTSVAIHVIAYFQLISADIFLLYCRIEWLGVGVVAYLLGKLMPSVSPRTQLMMLLRWMIGAMSALVVYIAYAGVRYVSESHARRRMTDFVLLRHGRIVRTLTHEQYDVLVTAEHRFYFMLVNRAFSLVWVIMFFGIAVYGSRYMRQMRGSQSGELSPEKYVPWWYAAG